ncbi:unnamed protein product [Mytilus edulis]|uniref:Uncharacterized protein n=1 Tax=Mytilus edulis TaxID=6550 RepID=A0A8S3SBU5_MYTED|nr:unnamed protein product [Mytilus edulis]
MNDPNAKLTWKQQRFSTPTPGTGPYGAKEGQYYSYMESSHPAASTGQELTATFVMRNEISEAPTSMFVILLQYAWGNNGLVRTSERVRNSKGSYLIKEGEQGNQWNLANISILPVSDLQVNIICTFEPEDPDCVFDLSKGDYNWDIKQVNVMAGIYQTCKYHVEINRQINTMVEIYQTGKTLSAHTGPSSAHTVDSFIVYLASDRPMGGTAVMSFKVPPMGTLYF